MILKGGCQMLVALVFYMPATMSTAREPNPRFDFVACAMQSNDAHGSFGACFVGLDQFCEKPDSGAFLECMNESIHRMGRYVVSNVALLPKTIETKRNFRKHFYQRILTRLAAFQPNAGVCGVSFSAQALVDASEKHNEAVERLAKTLCEGVNNSMGLSDLMTAARWANIELPFSEQIIPRNKGAAHATPFGNL
jgi:hypothetical protein